MKCILIIGFLLSAGLCYAQVNVYILLTNGDSISYNVDSVQSMKITPVTLPRYDILYATAQVRIPNTITIIPSDLDSIVFAIDTTGHHLLDFIFDTAAPHGRVPLVTNFHVVGPNKFGPNAPLEEITFGQYEYDTNVIQISEEFDAAWSGNQIYCAGEYASVDTNVIIELDSNLNAIQSTMIPPPSFGSICLNVDSSQSHLLSTFGTINSTIQEYEIKTGKRTVFSPVDESSDTIPLVSNAVYFKGGDDTIIFYAYGSYSDSTQDPVNAGYYLWDRKTNKSRLILHYISDMGTKEMQNGFDVSPDGKKLLIASTSNFRPPLFIEYSIETQLYDTLPVIWDTTIVNPALWVRYNHDGTEILYNNYPFNSFAQYDVGAPSEIGIVDHLTGRRTPLHVNPTSEGQWVGILPSWSPDDKHLVYSIGMLESEPPGSLGYQICILKTLR